MAEPFIGEIHIYPYTYPPYNWADCNGQQMSLAQYQALYAIVGTTFGGDGRTNFNLPNLMGRLPMGQGSGPGLTPRAYGSTGGDYTVTLNQSQMANHNHTLSFEREVTETAAPTGNYPGVFRQNGAGTELYDTDGTTNTVYMSPQAVGVTGGSQPHANMQPYMVLRFCIALEGNWPSRN